LTFWRSSAWPPVRHTPVPWSPMRQKRFARILSAVCALQVMLAHRPRVHPRPSHPRLTSLISPSQATYSKPSWPRRWRMRAEHVTRRFRPRRRSRPSYTLPSGLRLLPLQSQWLPRRRSVRSRAGLFPSLAPHHRSFILQRPRRLPRVRQSARLLPRLPLAR